MWGALAPSVGKHLRRIHLKRERSWTLTGWPPVTLRPRQRIWAGYVMEHGNGSQWSVVTLPVSGILNAISAVSASGVWAVGQKA